MRAYSIGISLGMPYKSNDGNTFQPVSSFREREEGVEFRPFAELFALSSCTCSGPRKNKVHWRGKRNSELDHALCSLYWLRCWCGLKVQPKRSFLHLSNIFSCPLSIPSVPLLTVFRILGTNSSDRKGEEHPAKVSSSVRLFLQSSR